MRHAAYEFLRIGDVHELVRSMGIRRWSQQPRHHEVRFGPHSLQEAHQRYRPSLAHRQSLHSEIFHTRLVDGVEDGGRVGGVVVSVACFHVFDGDFGIGRGVLGEQTGEGAFCVLGVLGGWAAD